MKDVKEALPSEGGDPRSAPGALREGEQRLVDVEVGDEAVLVGGEGGGQARLLLEEPGRQPNRQQRHPLFQPSSPLATPSNTELWKGTNLPT